MAAKPFKKLFENKEGGHYWGQSGQRGHGAAGGQRGRQQGRGQRARTTKKQRTEN